MSRPVTQPLAILHDSTTVEGVAYAIAFAQHERILRALKSWLGFTCAGVAAIIIPILHFIFVPLLLIVGAVLGVKRLRMVRMYTHASGICPRCQQAFELGLDAAQHFPKWTYCPHCRASLKLIQR
ncbi:MAG: hypothetical protein AABY83_09295 [Pseudomonadota bacterium]